MFVVDAIHQVGVAFLAVGSVECLDGPAHIGFGGLQHRGPDGRLGHHIAQPARGLGEGKEGIPAGLLLGAHRPAAGRRAGLHGYFGSKRMAPSRRTT